MTIPILLAVVGCDGDGDPRHDASSPAPPTAPVPAEATWTSEPPGSVVPRWIDTDGTPHFDDGVRFRDVSQVMNGIGLVGSIHRSSEMGHPAYRPELAGDPMAARGERWLEMVETLQTTYLGPTGLAGSLRPGGSDAGEWEAVSGTLEDLAFGAYAYHVHHRGGRWAEHGLEGRLTYLPPTLLVAPGIHTLRNHYRDGIFLANPESVDTDLASMAFGMSALHGHVYAWMRWRTPEGLDDHGRIPEERMAGWLEADVETLLGVSRAVATRLDEAWDDELGMYRFPTPPDPARSPRYVRMELSALGALLRGQKAIWEMLYVFGDEEDRALAERLADRSVRILTATLELSRPWGLPDRLRFGPSGVQPERDEVDVEALWRFVTDLTGGFSWNRAEEGTSELLAQRHPHVLEAVGRFTDEVLVGALAHHLDDDGFPVSVVCFAEGSPRDERRSPAVVGAFITAAANAYGTGTIFARPGAWSPDEPEAQERTRALYDALIRNVEYLESHAVLPAEAVH
ncbi:MAG: hypothetical protein EA422_06060 [Gemmatimonadales bacterium]|nr:MAG: hypothetical protein EA422_06060 [Gemmatimonadales bacterium]